MMKQKSSKKTQGSKISNDCSTSEKKGEKAVFKCDLCTFTSLSISSINHRMKIRSEEKYHVCHLCLKAFHSATLLHNHVNAHTGGTSQKPTSRLYGGVSSQSHKNSPDLHEAISSLKLLRSQLYLKTPSSYTRH